MKYGNGSVSKVAMEIANSDSSKALLQELASIFDVPIKGLPISEYHKKVRKRDEKVKTLKREL